MAATSAFTRINEPFELPKGFNPDGTDIVRCIDPSFGFFKPKEGVVYSFIMTALAGCSIEKNLLQQCNAQEMEETLRRCQNYEITFVSPALDEPNHEIKNKDIYIQAMIKKWSTTSLAASASVEIRPTIDLPIREVSIHPECPPGYEIFVITSGDLKDIIFEYRKGIKTIIGYKAVGKAIPPRLFETIHLHHPDFTTSTDIIHVNRDTRECQMRPYKAPAMFIGTKGAITDVVFEMRGDKKVVLGYGPYLKPLKRDHALTIIIFYTDHDIVVPYGVIRESYLSFDTNGFNSVIVKDGPLKGLILKPEGKFFRLDEQELANISPSAIELIHKRFPMIVLPISQTQ